MGAWLTPAHDQHRNRSTVVVVVAVGSSRIGIKEAMVAVEIRSSSTLDLVPVLPCTIQGLVVTTHRDLVRLVATALETRDGQISETRVLDRTVAEMG